MPISQTAQQNHEQLFPGHISTLPQTDPELIEIFDNFAFDEVASPRRPRCAHPADGATRGPDRRQALQRVPGDARRRPHRRRHPGRGEGDRLPGGPLRRHGQGLRLPARHQRGPHRAAACSFRCRASRRPRRTPAPSSASPCRSRSSATSGSRRMYANAPDDEQHIQRFLSANCFGDHVARAGIDLPTRELLTFAMLAALGGCEPQLKGHVAGQPQRRQRARRAAGRPHPAHPLHRLPPHPQRPTRARRGHPRLTAATAIEERDHGAPASQLAAADVVLAVDVLDRIDEILPPGVTVDPADNGWVNLFLQPAARRR